MARARFIRPEFFTDEKVSDLPFGAALLFCGIWCHSDLRGVFEHSPRVLRGLIFPMRDGIDTATVGEWLTQLEAQGMIGSFEAAGKRWGFVKNWKPHQTMTTKEIEIGSRRPIPPGWEDPPEWAATIAKAKAGGRIGRDSPWVNPGSILGQSQNYTPTPTPTPAEGACAPVDEYEQERKWLRGLGAITERKGACIIADWKAATKRLKVGQVEQVFRETSPGIQWPSEFKRQREARGI